MPTAEKKKILIVNDAVVVRKSLALAIADDPAMEVAGTASNGRLALAKLPGLRPDLILLDIEMPEMDGIQTLVEIRKFDPRVPIVMFSTLTQHGASSTLEALGLGATDYVLKPSNSDMNATIATVSGELLPKIRALCRIPEPRPDICRPGLPPANAPIKTKTRPQSALPARAIAIGVSTGGPEALSRLLPVLPAKLPVPIFIVQHMPAVFTSLLAHRLSARCAMPVRECESGEPAEPGCIYLAPGDYHMVAVKEDRTVRLRTHQGPKENFCRPSVDVLFRSVAQVYAGHALGVVLTGMGQDGLKGSEVLSAAGSRILAQDEATSVVWGMPGFVARSGVAEKILPLDLLGGEITRIVSGPPRSTRT